MVSFPSYLEFERGVIFGLLIMNKSRRVCACETDFGIVADILLEATEKLVST